MGIIKTANPAKQLLAGPVPKFPYSGMTTAGKQDARILRRKVLAAMADAPQRWNVSTR
jgi:hypothetical protein